MDRSAQLHSWTLKLSALPSLLHSFLSPQIHATLSVPCPPPAIVRIHEHAARVGFCGLLVADTRRDLCHPPPQQHATRAVLLRS